MDEKHARKVQPSPLNPPKGEGCVKTAYHSPCFTRGYSRLTPLGSRA